MALATLGCLSTIAHAQQLRLNGSTNLNLDIPALPDVSVARDKPPGTLIGERAVEYILSASNITCPVTRTVTVNGMTAPGYTNLFQTSQPGIGIQFFVPTFLSAMGGYVIAPDSRVIMFSDAEGPASATNPVNYSGTYTVGASYGKIAQTTSGVLTAMPSITIRWSGPCIATATATHSMPNNVTRITAETCSVTTPSVNVTLPPVAGSRLRPVGATGGDQVFSIGLNCMPGLNLKMTLTDNTNPGNRSDQLTLSPTATAQGVNLRILNAGTPISFGAASADWDNLHQIDLGHPAAGAVTIPLSVQYVSTGIVVPGSVNARAIFTMSYQ